MMLNISVVGLVTLNISFVLYMIYYLPQLFHNAKAKNLLGLSVYFHLLLTLSYLTDLVYGFGMDMPWQYRLVSLVGLSCLLYQHYQLWKIRNKQIYFKWITGGLMMLLMLAVIVFICHPMIRQEYLVLGFASQILGIVCSLPQVWHNFRVQSVGSLSLLYLVINGGCVLCDNMSAWLLCWPIPNKMGCAIRAILLLIIFLQYYYYQSNRQKLKTYAMKLLMQDKLMNECVESQSKFTS